MRHYHYTYWQFILYYQYMDIKTVIANNVKIYRKELWLWQEALSDKAWIHRTHMSLIERGKSNMTIDVLEKIAEALWKRIEELVTKQ